MTDELNPQNIVQVAVGYWASKALFSASEVGVFTALEQMPMTSEQLIKDLGVHPRGSKALFDALVGLGLLQREGDDLYRNTPEADAFLVPGRPTYMGGLLTLLDGPAWHAWSGLADAVRTGLPQNHLRGSDRDTFFDRLSADPEKLKAFITAMSGASTGPAQALAALYPWEQHRSVIDIGTAQGRLPVELARAHPHLTVGGFDLPHVGPVFDAFVAESNLAGRVKFWPGDFFTESLPAADVLVMGHILHDWSLEEKKMLLGKAHDAIPSGGALIVYESIIDDDRRSNVFGLLMSLNMLVETRAGFDYTGAECSAWMKESGFSETSVRPLIGPYSMVIGVK